MKKAVIVGLMVLVPAVFVFAAITGAMTGHYEPLIGIIIGIPILCLFLWLGKD